MDRKKLNPKDYIWFDEWHFHGRVFVEWVDDDNAYFVEEVTKTCPVCLGKGQVRSWWPSLDDTLNEDGEPESEMEDCDECDTLGWIRYDDWDNYYTEDEFHLMRKQTELLEKRYGTEKPKSIKDFFEVTE